MQNTIEKKKRMTQTITRYVTTAVALASLACLVNFISASSGTAESRNAFPGTLSQTPLVEKIITLRDFFVHFDGYNGDLLCDVSDTLGEGKVGLLLLEPSGFLKSLVFERGTLEKIHENANIPPKKLRSELNQRGILVSDAQLIARNIAELRTEKGRTPRRKTALRDTPRREVMPQSLPAGFAPAGAQRDGAGEILEHLRREVENNAEVSAMTSGEIMKRFRSDVQNSPEPRKAGGSR
jgi:hypothetical protein